MVLMDVMKNVLNIFFAIMLVATSFVATPQVWAADGSADPLQIVSDAEKMPTDVTPVEVNTVVIDGVEIDVDQNTAAALASQTAPTENATSTPMSDAYTIGASDKLRVTVYGEQDLSKVYQVDGLGMVSIPLVGQIKVAGMTLRQAEDLLVVALSNGYLVDPSVAIEIAEFRPFYIMGEVRRPGSYSYIDGMNVLKAVAISGGFTYRANANSIEVVRSSEGGKKLRLLPTSSVLPGDIIRVKERFF